MSKRCDEAEDCRDRTDEKDCQTLFLDESKYRKSFKPEAIEGNLEIFVNIRIFNIDSVSEIDGEYRVQFGLSLSWTDPRLLYMNLKEDILKNIVGEEIAKKLWIPPLRFPRLSSRKNRVEYDEEADVFVSTLGEGMIAPYTFIDESKIYAGAENQLGYYRMFQGTHQCQFDLADYPFDYQDCSIQVLLGLF